MEIKLIIKNIKFLKFLPEIQINYLPVLHKSYFLHFKDPFLTNHVHMFARLLKVTINDLRTSVTRWLDNLINDWPFSKNGRENQRNQIGKDRKDQQASATKATTYRLKTRYNCM